MSFLFPPAVSEYKGPTLYLVFPVIVIGNTKRCRWNPPLIRIEVRANLLFSNLRSDILYNSVSEKATMYCTRIRLVEPIADLPPRLWFGFPFFGNVRSYIPRLLLYIIYLNKLLKSTIFLYKGLQNIGTWKTHYEKEVSLEQALSVPDSSFIVLLKDKYLNTCRIQHICTAALPGSKRKFTLLRYRYQFEFLKHLKSK